MVDFHVTRIVERPRDLVFAVVADVERYPEFVPGFSDAHVRPAGANRLEVVQRVGKGGLSMRFRSTAELLPPRRIEIRSHDGPFEELRQVWTLEEIDGERTRVDFDTHYALASDKLQRLVGRLLDRQLRQMIGAFERRLAELPPDAAP